MSVCTSTGADGVAAWYGAGAPRGGAVAAVRSATACWMSAACFSGVNCWI
jgi:hypothetical protein